MRQEKTSYLKNSVNSCAQVIHIVRLMIENIGNHLRQKWCIATCIQGTQVHHFGDVKQEILINYIPKDLRCQPVLLQVSQKKNI